MAINLIQHQETEKHLNQSSQNTYVKAIMDTFE